MVLIIKHMARVVVATIVSVLLLTALMTGFFPLLAEKINLNVGAAQLEEPPVLRVSVGDSHGDAVSLSAILENVKANYHTDKLDEPFWDPVLDNPNNIFVYKKTAGVFKQQEFNGTEASTWMLIFTSSNSAGDKYKLMISLDLS